MDRRKVVATPILLTIDDVQARSCSHNQENRRTKACHGKYYKTPTTISKAHRQQNKKPTSPCFCVHGWVLTSKLSSRFFSWHVLSHTPTFLVDAHVTGHRNMCHVTSAPGKRLHAFRVNGTINDGLSSTKFERDVPKICRW